MLKGGVIQKLLEEKWKTFGHVSSYRSFIINIFTNDCVHFILKASISEKNFSNSFSSIDIKHCYLFASFEKRIIDM
jgi:hypothetical protein